MIFPRHTSSREDEGQSVEAGAMRWPDHVESSLKHLAQQAEISQVQIGWCDCCTANCSSSQKQLRCHNGKNCFQKS
jgi:hypothetical protein